MKTYNFCNNCGKVGHLYHHCKNPITSLGIICFRINKNNKIEYLLIRRKDSLGYVDFLRGKYPLYSYDYIQNIIQEMSIEEQEKLRNKSFSELWNDLWGDYIGIQHRGEQKISEDKFNLLKSGINLQNKSYDLETILNNNKSKWEEPEWGFPKGRRNYQEKDLNCALREFEEETGYDKNKLLIINNLIPFDEIFTGSNYKSYKHRYYLAFMENNINPIKTPQTSEVSSIKWSPIDDANLLIRPYNLEKIIILNRVDYILNNYKYYI